ncbi:MAG: hypothetical protein EXQ52_14260 [Bryobacterales bacterium]|nr:hypothetical protein [Bryobacterales bacterium]
MNTGDKLGPYEIVSPIGAGGMGEVYKARDTRLDRTVAIKVLPEHIAKREDLRARRAAASMNHPDIRMLHDQALKFAAQVAGFLDCGHRARVTRRERCGGPEPVAPERREAGSTVEAFAAGGLCHVR